MQQDTVVLEMLESQINYLRFLSENDVWAMSLFQDA